MFNCGFYLLLIMFKFSLESFYIGLTSKLPFKRLALCKNSLGKTITFLYVYVDICMCLPGLHSFCCKRFIVADYNFTLDSVFSHEYSEMLLNADFAISHSHGETKAQAVIGH